MRLRKPYFYNPESSTLPRHRGRSKRFALARAFATRMHTITFAAAGLGLEAPGSERIPTTGTILQLYAWEPVVPPPPPEAAIIAQQQTAIEALISDKAALRMQLDVSCSEASGLKTQIKILTTEVTCLRAALEAAQKQPQQHTATEPAPSPADTETLELEFASISQQAGDLMSRVAALQERFSAPRAEASASAPCSPAPMQRPTSQSKTHKQHKATTVSRPSGGCQFFASLILLYALLPSTYPSPDC